MITVDFSLAVGLFFLFLTGGIFLLWILSRKEKNKESNPDTRYIWHCSICTHTYINTKEEVISSCPKCGSLNKR